VIYKIFSGVLRADSITNSSNHYSSSSSCRFSHPGSTLWGTVVAHYGIFAFPSSLRISITLFMKPMR
jgi:hypothetical protein